MKSTARRRNLLSVDLSVFVLAAVVAGINGLRDVAVDIPEAVAVGSTVSLTCLYDMEKEILYAVKWYKSKSEFYRFLPKESPPIAVFGDFQNNIDKTRSDAHRVTLTNVTQDMDGKYRCEVTTDGLFHTLLKAGYMHVVTLPQGIPEVLVEKQRYAIGETAKANCTTPPSNPPANVNWAVNGLPLNSTHQKIIQLKNDNRSRTYAELDYEISQNSFSNGRLQIACHANIFHLYEREAIVFLDEERPRLASVLGTRDSPHTANGASRHFAAWIWLIVMSNILFYLR